jgi:transketolase
MPCSEFKPLDVIFPKNNRQSEKQIKPIEDSTGRFLPFLPCWAVAPDVFYLMLNGGAPSALFPPMTQILDIIRTARKRLLRMHYEAHAGHIGGNLSSLEIVMTLHHCVMQKDDVFILSKGHAAGALYVALWTLGHISDEVLSQFHKDGTKLSGHPAACWLPQIPFATGSLGHGLPLACGVAFGKTIQSQPGRVFCLLSDGEMQEGSTWEAIIFAARRNRLPLTVFIDVNRLQGFGRTDEVTGLKLTPDKFREFGLPAEEIDGHDANAIIAACADRTSGPRVVIAHTRKGHGVSFMENRMEWHYLPMTEEQYRQALQEADLP